MFLHAAEFHQLENFDCFRQAWIDETILLLHRSPFGAVMRGGVAVEEFDLSGKLIDKRAFEFQGSTPAGTVSKNDERDVRLGE